MSEVAVGDTYVDIEVEVGEEDEAFWFVYQPDEEYPDRPWLLSNRDPLTDLIYGSGDIRFMHEGDLKERIADGGVRQFDTSTVG